MRSQTKLSTVVDPDESTSRTDAHLKSTQQKFADVSVTCSPLRSPDWIRFRPHGHFLFRWMNGFPRKVKLLPQKRDERRGRILHQRNRQEAPVSRPHLQRGTRPLLYTLDRRVFFSSRPRDQINLHPLIGGPASLPFLATARPALE